ncbi:hypothetical protein PG985_009948 [Apiospora marii]|uniref:uncharacterized protein n=1 Tax=Apiospora marii TaxID=335849 RepID=UPI00312EB826
MAVIRNDLGGVARILERCPHALSETDVFGQSPLHLAREKAGVLSLLTKAADLDQLDHQDEMGFTALETAMLLSADQCVNDRRPERCQSCDCAKAVHILLEAGCSVRTTRSPYRSAELDLNRILEPASELARQRYIFHMQELRISPRLYERPLQESMSCYGTSSSHHIRAVEGNPSKQGEAHRISGAINGGKDWSWVYQEIDYTEFAELFYDNGFRPGASFFLHQFWWGMDTWMDTSYFCWLVEHGVDLFNRSLAGPSEADYGSEVGVFGAHHAFFVMGRTMAVPGRWKPWQGVQIPVELSANLLLRNLKDCCECYCSVDGCSPFTWMMKGMAFGMTTGWPRRRGLRGYKDCAQLHYGSCGMELTALTFKSAITFFTFQALGLVHTCCLMEEVGGKGFGGPDTEPRYQWLGRDEANIINEEQGFLLKIHEELVAEFIEEASGYLEVESDGSEEEPEHSEEASNHLADMSKSSDGSENSEDWIECSSDGSEYSEEPSNHDSGFSRFWSEYWVVRMEEKLEELEGNQITDAERQDAEAIGVQWEEESEESEEEIGRNPHHRDELDWWLFELDLICSDA